MKKYNLVCFSADSGPRVGVLVQGRIHDLSQATGRPADVSMMELLADWPAALDRIRSVVESALAGQGIGFEIEARKLLSPLPLPGTIFCAGANYTDHVLEMARVANIEPDADPRTLGHGSWHFIKSSRSVIGPGDLIEIPNGSKKLDWEVELAAVIGQKARNLSKEQALACVAGYTVAVDLSARDLSRRSGVSLQSPFRFDWVSHKSFDTACPLGPWLTPAEQIHDPQNLSISLSVNDEIKQNSNTSQMIFTVAEQIADLSQKLTLWPGDVILTGTPAGVGSATGQFLKPGDRLSARIEEIGELRSVVG